MPLCIRCESLVCEHARSRRSSKGHPLLVHIELSILARLVSGQNPKEIAFDIKKKSGNVYVRITQMRWKLGLDSTAALIAWGKKNLRVTQGEK
jgi:DNA-binding NarL/FixJ family response regulator